MHWIDGWTWRTVGGKGLWSPQREVSFWMFDLLPFCHSESVDMVSGADYGVSTALLNYSVTDSCHVEERWPLSLSWTWDDFGINPQTEPSRCLWKPVITASISICRCVWDLVRPLYFLSAIKLQVLSWLKLIEVALLRFSALTIWPSLPAAGRECCIASLKCLTVGSRAAACPMLRFIIRLKTRGSLRTHFLQTSLPKALTRPEDGMLLFFLSFYWFDWFRRYFTEYLAFYQLGAGEIVSDKTGSAPAVCPAPPSALSKCLLSWDVSLQ